MKENRKDLLTQPPQKVLLMYRSVIDMINEGIEINTIKVADITKRAGIGKGTAYEYFTTKEEIILKALMYQMLEFKISINDIIYSAATFQEKVYALLDFGYDHYDEGRTFYQILKILIGGYHVSDSLKQEFQELQQTNICKYWPEVQSIIFQAGIEEQILKQCDKKLYQLVFNSQVMAFIMLLHDNVKQGNPNANLEESKEFIYNSIVKLLG